jgi:CheY-like chemotaxis protein
VMDGYELAGLLRQKPRLAKVPLVAITGYAQKGDRSARSRAVSPSTSRSRSTSLTCSSASSVSYAPLQARACLQTRPGFGAACGPIATHRRA